MSDPAAEVRARFGDCEEDALSPWLAEDDYQMLSMAFTLRSHSVEVARALRWHLQPFRRTAPPRYGFPVDVMSETDEEGKDGLSFYLANQWRFRSESPTAVLGHAIWDLHTAVLRRARDFLFVHAGAVCRDGGALLLPATAESGKSTLVLALLREGFSYLSDDVGALDPVTLRAYPFPKLIKILPATLRFFDDLAVRLPAPEGLSAGLRERFVRPEDVGAAVGEPTDVRWVVFPTPDWEGPPRLVPLPRAEALELLVAGSFNLSRYRRRGVVMLSRVVERAPAFRLEGGSSVERSKLLADRMT